MLGQRSEAAGPAKPEQSSLLSLLKRIEFHQSDDYYTAQCPECDKIKPDHEPDCELKRLIDELEGEK